ncbi:2,5-diamino-6-ribosylamino-4(3H)-pyrimidinone 5'-phosphate reductase [Variovorax sp. SRS16]|uniref:RibD family protein n=1 Tax=Variovorax sp. SRS16 TaxID=282217 RepID=UPI0013176F63|nr:RibD family protein [Variovorax sp. SRS16]VTU15523.1 2,5-diamino-6-ribosylamino-4(3H)-pyrimidinone 5'-phosphate reductase [Variovorax sp. SRS16]
MKALPSRLPGIDALWPWCLDIAARRRGQPVTQAWDAQACVGWDASQGFSLRGVWDEAAVELFDLLKPLLDRPPGAEPWAIGQLGQSLDGCVATHGGDSNFVNGPEVLLHLHRLRALCDAVIVGAGTAAIDNPQLTTRRVAGRHPVRVVLDPALRLPPGLRVFSDHQAPTLLACDASRAAQAAERVGAAQVLGVPALVGADGLIDLHALLAALARRGLAVLFVEGGGITVSHFIAQGCLDRLHLSVAPVIIGGGRPGLQLPRSNAMRECMRPSNRAFRMGGDVLWDLDLRA